MITPANPSNPKSAGDDRNLVAVDAKSAVTFEEKLQVFWEKNRMVVIGGCVLVILAIVGREGWAYLERQKEADVESAYAAAVTSEQLKTFAAAHSDHSLAAMALLRLADEAYAAGKAADAVAGYDKVLAIIKDGPLAGRVRLGRAMAKVQAGTGADGTAELKQIAGDASQFKAIRAEAAYQLASLAAEAGNAADVQKYAEQVSQIDSNPNSNPWMSRAMILRASLPPPPPVAAPPAGTPATPAPAATKDEAPAGVQFKLPGK